MKIICDCWLMCKIRNNCTNFRIQNEFWWLIESKITYYLFENLNSQLMKIIEFNEYKRKIDQNFFRSIIRVKRIYWIFFYRKCFIVANTIDCCWLREFCDEYSEYCCKTEINFVLIAFCIRFLLIIRIDKRAKRNIIAKLFKSNFNLINRIWIFLISSIWWCMFDFQKLIAFRKFIKFLSLFIFNCFNRFFFYFKIVDCFSTVS